MRNEQLLILFITILISSCGTESGQEAGKVDTIAIDTIYFTNQKDDPAFKAPFIRLSSDSTFESSSKIEVNVYNNLYISVINYPGYKIHLKNLQNINLKNSYPDMGLFVLAATDSLYQFDIFMDFGEGNVLMKYKSENSTEFRYKPYNGLRFIGRVSEKNL